MYLRSLYNVYEYIKDVTPKTVFVTGFENEYRSLLNAMSSGQLVGVGPKKLPEVLEFLGVRRLLEAVDRGIKSVGGVAFVRWDNHYPKDACVMLHDCLGLEVLPKTMGNACLVRSATEFIFLSANSLRTLSFIRNEGEHALYPVAVREPLRDLRHEFRVVVHKGHVKAVLQYYHEEDYGLQEGEAIALAKEMAGFVLSVAGRLPAPSAVLDVGVSEGRFVVIEATPPPHVAPVSLPGLNGRVSVEALYGAEKALLTLHVGGRLRSFWLAL